MTEHLTVTIKVVWDEERITDLWSQVMGGAFEYCSWWREVRYIGEADWDKPGKVTLVIENPGSTGAKTKRKTIGPKDVVQALYTAMERGHRDACTGRPITEHMDWDQCSSDVVLQIAVLGEVVYG